LTEAEARFGNDAQNMGYNQKIQKFNAQNTARGLAQNEQYAARNQPINEIIALLSGSQVQMPNFPVNQPSAIPTTDNAGLINQKYNQDFAGYQQKYNAQQGLLGGLFGLGAAGITGASAAGGFGSLFGRK
jgi:hypothetical protein